MHSDTERMKVRDCYRPRSDFAAVNDSLREAARRMRSAGLGCVAVLDGNRVVGIVTERDMVDAVARGVPPSNACVGAYTSDGSITVTLDDDCQAAELKMLAIGCRHLPVVDDGKLVGMISMRDVILRGDRHRVAVGSGAQDK